MRKKPSILIVDDDERWLSTIKSILSNDYECTTTTRGINAINTYKKNVFSLVVIDKRLPDLDGIKVLREMINLNPNLGAIILTGHADFESAVESMKIGAIDYISKGDKNLTEKLKVTVVEALEKSHEREKKARKILYADVVGDECQNPLHSKIIEEFFPREE